MLRYYLTVIVRQVARSKTIFLVNVMGLSTGLAAFMLIYLWIADEVSFDKFHTNDGKLYQLMSNLRNENGVSTREATPIGMAYVLEQTFPEVEHAATVTPNAWFPKFLLSADDLHIKAEGKFVGENFFKLFSYKLLHGEVSTALKDKYSVVITASLARKLFRDPRQSVGKILPWKLSTISRECTITGVVQDVPANSSQQFDVLFPIDLLGEIMGFPKDDLNAPGPGTFVLLREDVNVEALNQKVNDFMRAHTRNANESFFAVPFSSKYLYGKFENGKQAGGRIVYVRIFSIVGIFILLLACINFVNLSTARASKRLKEIGVAKVLGADRWLIIKQHLLESICFSVLALVGAVSLVLLVLPLFNTFSGKVLALSISVASALQLSSLGVCTGVLAGIYPAFYLSAFRSTVAMKGKLVNSASERLVRNGLVVFQFVISVVFVVFMLITYLQMEYLQNKNLGYNRNNVLYFENEGSIPLNLENFTNRLSSIRGVTKVSGMVGNIISDFGPAADVIIDERKLPFNVLRIYEGMIETLEIKLRMGRTFSAGTSDESSIILNQAAIDMLGLADPVGQTINFNGEQLTIIGVTDNFHLQSLHRSIAPTAFRLETGQPWNIFVRIDQDNQRKTLQAIERLYHEFNAGYAFDYHFLNSDFQNLYAAENRLSGLTAGMGILSIVISSLGLFGLAAFTAQRRMKEIGIRKVLGASSASILHLVSRDLLTLVLISLCISLPLGYVVSRRWLSGFAYAIPLSAWHFVAAAFMAIFIAILTVWAQAFRAAMANPVESIR
jgi:putative ABC transport system permease protein